MSIINSANPGSQIDLMCIIYRVLSRATGPVAEDKLLSLCNPETLGINEDQKKRMPGELRFWSETLHQLWEKNSSNEYALLTPGLGKYPIPTDIASIVRKILMDIDMPSVFDQNNDWDGVNQLMAVLSCMLAVPDFSPLQGKGLDKATLDDLQRSYLPAGILLNASNEISEVLAYASFLGFLEPGEEGGYVVDPTRIVAESIKDMLQPGQVMGIHEVVEKLSKASPVFDGGIYRREVESVMAERDFTSPPENRLSRTMSHALYRLRIAGVVKIEELSDDPNQVTFDLLTGDRKYSRIQLLEAEG